MKEVITIIISGAVISIAASIALRSGARLCGIVYTLAAHETENEISNDSSID